MRQETTKEYYFFFDRHGIPVAVFLTETQQRAIELFVKLYRKSWENLVNDDFITVIREKDISLEELNRICTALKIPKRNYFIHKPIDEHLIRAAYAMRELRKHYLENQVKKNIFVYGNYDVTQGYVN